MTSRKGQRRVQAPKTRQPQRRERRADRRVLIAIGAVVVLVALGIGLGVALAGGSSGLKNVPAKGSLTNKLTLPQAAQVHKLLAGVPQRGNVLGKASAPVTMIEYIDLQCPFCDQFELTAFPDLVSQYVKDGTLKIEAVPLAFIGPDSERGRLAAIAAAKQNKMFNFMEVLYANQGTENTGWLTNDEVTKAAASVPGLDVQKLLAGAKLASAAKLAKSFDKSALAAQVRQTPTIYVGPTGKSLTQVKLTNASDKASVVAAINRVLNAG
jgi:protein-disulfide isomerase